MSIAEKDLTTIAFCWRLERRDGVAIGLTSHDRDLSHAGLVYRATPGMLPSSIALSEGFDSEALEIEGAISADAITQSDLAAGRWDGATVALFMLNWADPAAPPLPLTQGVLGGVTVRGAAFEAVLRGPAAMLERAVVEQTSPGCRAELGDKRCRVDMAARVRVTRVALVLGESLIEVADSPDGNACGYGRLRWIGGRNSGLETAIAASDGVRLVLRDAPHFPPEAGDLVELGEGCDKTFETCRSRFGNAANFRGEPHLPGMDLLTRYPGA